MQSFKYKDILHDISITTNDILENQKLLKMFNDQLVDLTNYNTDLKMFSRELSYIRSNHPCSTDYLHKLDQVIGNLKSSVIADMLTHQFYNPKVMKNAQCLIENVFYTSPWGNSFTPEERARLNLKNIMLISDTTLNSTAYIVNYNAEKNFTVVIKEGKEYYSINSLAHEAFIGLYAINKLRSFCPNFMYTYGLVTENKFINRSDTNIPIEEDESNDTIAYIKQKNYQTFHILLEGINDAISLSNYIKTCTIKNFLDVFMQILYALEIAQHHIDFTHYDLHTENILIKKADKATQIVYHRPDGTKRYVTSENVAVIIDFGYAHVKVDDENYGILRHTPYGVNNNLHAMFDVYKLIGFCSLDYLLRIKTTNKASKNFDYFFTQLWKIFDPSKMWQQIVIEQSEVLYTYNKSLSYGPELLSEFIDMLEEIFKLSFDRDLALDNLNCENNKCYSSKEIWELENLNTFASTPKDIISMFDLYNFLKRENNIQLANNILEDFVNTNDFTDTFDTVSSHVKGLLDEANVRKEYYFEELPFFEKNDIIIYPKMYNNTIFQYIDLIYLLNEANFNIKILYFYEQFLPQNKINDLEDYVITYETFLTLTKEVSIFFKQLYDYLLSVDKQEKVKFIFLYENLPLIHSLSLL